jgi:pimeloyl-ACP methyl ester carboxylesterase
VAGEILDGYVEVSEQLTVHYRAAGDGDLCLVMVPGWTMSARAFERQLSHYSGSNDVRVIAIDPRGQGLSTVTQDGHTYEQHARDLRAVLEALGVERFVLAGWSNGGAEILEYVRLFGSGGLRGLLLIDSPPKPVGENPMSDWVWYGSDILNDPSYRRFLYDVAADRDARNRELAQSMFEEPTDEAVSLVLEMASHTPTSVAVTLAATYLFVDNTDELEALDAKIPLLFFTRADTERAARDWAATHTPNAKIESFGAHMLFWERPHDFHRALDHFLERIT